MLEIAPTLEHEIVERAEASGLTPEEFLLKLLASAPVAPAAREIHSPYTTSIDSMDDEKRAAVLAYITAPAEEIVRLHAPHIAHLQDQLTEAANATPEEVAQADAEWEEHKRQMNAHRAITGERPVYANVAPYADVAPAGA